MAKRKNRAARKNPPPVAGAAVPPAQDLERALKQAVEAHQTGNLAAAETGYRAVLEKAPDNPYALHFMGVIALQNGNPEKAVELIEKAITGVPQFADAWSNLGAAYHALKRMPDAERAFR